MRLSTLTLLFAAVLAAGACKSRSADKNMTRPDVGPDHVWAGTAIPTGDANTSVLTIEKVLPADIVPDQPYEYSIRVTNITKSTALTDVVVTDDPRESGFLMHGSTPEATRSGEKMVWKLGNLQPGASTEIRVSGESGMAGLAPTCSSVTYAEVIPPKPVAPPPPPAPPAPPPPTAELQLTKMVPAEASVYDEVPIKIVVKNVGKGQAKDVKVTDELPDGWTVNGQKSVTFAVGTLEPGASKELTAKAKSSRPGKFSNKATASAAGGLTATSSTNETTVYKVALEIAKTVDKATVPLGRAASFKITVKNTGDRAAENATLTDTFTGADTVSGASDGGTVAGKTVTWKLGSIAPGASRTVTVSGNRGAPGAISNSATATATSAQPVSANASANVVGVSGVGLEVIDGPDPVFVGGTTTYTIKVTNQGSAPDSQIAVVCTLEDAVEFVSAAGATTGTRNGATVTFAPLANLAPKETVSWTVVVKGVKAADSRFKVTLNTHEAERPVEETEATRIYE
jgi:uncharacterized repeat protein (TIGR01451 family)